MSSAREIRSKIKSVQNIQKITLAMQMVSASKMRKAQDRMFASRPYATKILDVISNLREADPQYYHPYMVIRDIKRIGMIVITSDRGLCSALNINVLKLAVAELKQWSLKKVEEDLCLIGNKAESFFKRHGGNIIVKANHLGDSNGINDLIDSVKIMLDSYRAQKIDGLYIYFNEFINTMVQRPKVQQLLPIMSYEIEKPRHRWDYIYEPNSYVLLDRLLDRYIESQIYQSAVENIACEYAARMVAMKSATDNAKNLIDDFKLKYNKARQATITNEISEIVSGAEAV